MKQIQTGRKPKGENIMLMNVLSNEAIEEIVRLSQELKFAIEFETTKCVSEDTDELCDTCGGHGDRECYDCEGTGYVTTYYLSGGVSYRYASRCDFVELSDATCPTCDGSGRVECDECDGEDHTNDVGGNFQFPWDEVKDEHCGGEMVTGSMDWKKWKAYRYALKNDIEENIRVHSSTGGHTHVDWSWLYGTGKDLNTFTNIAHMIYVLDEYIQEYLNTDVRRRMGTFTKKHKDYKSSSLPMWDYVDVMVTNFKNNNMWNYPKYTWLNVGRIERKAEFYNNTLEFRVFDSTNNIFQAEFNASFAQAFVLFAYSVENEVLSNLMDGYDDKQRLARDLFDTILMVSHTILERVFGQEYHGYQIEA